MNLRMMFFCLVVLIFMAGCSPVQRSYEVIANQQRNVSLGGNKEPNTSVKQKNSNNNQSSAIVENTSTNQPKNEGSKIIDNGEKQSEEKYFDTAKYDGKWISTNYQIVQMDGYTANFGSELYLKSEKDGIMEMSMEDIDAPPASRIASIKETEVKISPEGKGTFKFDNDGWGSHGSGTIELQENKIIINIDSQIEEGKNPDWRIYSGQKVFVRENNAQDTTAKK